MRGGDGQSFELPDGVAGQGVHWNRFGLLEKICFSHGHEA